MGPIQYSYDVCNDIKVKDYKYKILYGYYTKIGFPSY